MSGPPAGQAGRRGPRVARVDVTRVARRAELLQLRGGHVGAVLALALGGNA